MAVVVVQRQFRTSRVVTPSAGRLKPPGNARVWQRDRAATSVGAFVPLSFAPSEAYQFDWSHEVVLINGTTVTVAHVRLCHSRMLFVRAYPRETQEMVFDADAVSTTTICQDLKFITPFRLSAQANAAAGHMIFIRARRVALETPLP
jgi:hypothetical protein